MMIFNGIVTRINQDIAEIAIQKLKKEVYVILSKHHDLSIGRPCKIIYENKEYMLYKEVKK